VPQKGQQKCECAVVCSVVSMPPERTGNALRAIMDEECYQAMVVGGRVKTVLSVPDWVRVLHLFNRMSPHRARRLPVGLGRIGRTVCGGTVLSVMLEQNTHPSAQQTKGSPLQRVGGAGR